MIKKVNSVSFIFILVAVFLSGGQEVKSRSFDAAAMAAYKEQAAFDYMSYTVQPPSIWDRLMWWIQSIFREIFSNPNTPWLTQIAYYLILTLVVGAAIFYIIRLRYGGALSSESTGYGMGIQQLQETVAADFDRLIQEALTEQNFKLAIRYQYLKALSLLGKDKRISLKDWKSPYDYEKELSGDLAIPYRQLSRLFEYVWYGDFEAGEREYQEGVTLANELEGKR